MTAAVNASSNANPGLDERRADHERDRGDDPGDPSHVQLERAGSGIASWDSAAMTSQAIEKVLVAKGPDDRRAVSERPSPDPGVAARPLGMLP